MGVDFKLIGQRIKASRKQIHITQETLSEMLNVSVGYISQIECGTTKVSLDMLGKISDILKKDIAYFVTGSSPRQQNYLTEEMSDIFYKLEQDDKILALNLVKTILENKKGKGKK